MIDGFLLTLACFPSQIIHVVLLAVNKLAWHELSAYARPPGPNFLIVFISSSMVLLLRTLSLKNDLLV